MRFEAILGKQLAKSYLNKQVKFGSSCLESRYSGGIGSRMSPRPVWAKLKPYLKNNLKHKGLEVWLKCLPSNSKCKA
jgi:hypothetical protein